MSKLDVPNFYSPLFLDLCNQLVLSINVIDYYTTYRTYHTTLQWTPPKTTRRYHLICLAQRIILIKFSMFLELIFFRHMENIIKCIIHWKLKNSCMLKWTSFMRNSMSKILKGHEEKVNYQGMLKSTCADWFIWNGCFQKPKEWSQNQKCKVWKN